MKEIVERLQENRQVELAKKILESNGYTVTTEDKRLSEYRSDGESDSEESNGVEAYYLLSIDASTNAPDTKYYGPERVQRGEEILKSAGISDSNVEVLTVGYEDISFSVKSDDKRYVDKIARKISAYSTEPGESVQMDWELPEGDCVSISGPYYDNGEFGYVDSRVEFWSR